MESIRWVDKTNTDKHKDDANAHIVSWYAPLQQLTDTRLGASPETKEPRNAALSRLHTFFQRMAKRSLFSVGIYFASQLPYVGPLVYPVATFTTFHRAVGPVPAAGIFLLGIILPKRLLIIFFQSFFSSRSMMRVLVSVKQFHPRCSTEANISCVHLIPHAAFKASTILRSHPIYYKSKVSMVFRA